MESTSPEMWRRVLCSSGLIFLLCTGSAMGDEPICPKEGQVYVCTGGEKGVFCACLGGPLEEMLIFDLGGQGPWSGGFGEALELDWHVDSCPPDGAGQSDSLTRDKQVRLVVTVSDPNGDFEPRTEEFELGAGDYAHFEHRFADFADGQSNPVYFSANTYVHILDDQGTIPGAASCRPRLVSARQYRLDDGATSWSITNAWPSKFSGPSTRAGSEEASRLLVRGSASESGELYLSANCKKQGPADGDDTSVIPTEEEQARVLVSMSDPYGAIAPTTQEVVLKDGDVERVAWSFADYELGNPSSSAILIIAEDIENQNCAVSISGRTSDSASGQTRSIIRPFIHRRPDML